MDADKSANSIIAMLAHVEEKAKVKTCRNFYFTAEAVYTD